jgi:hypothetical protein
MASFVADAIQQVLMDLRLEHVPLVSLYGHTPSLPLVLVSTPEETLSPCDSDVTTPKEEPVTPHSNDTESRDSVVLSQQNSEPAGTAVDILTPVSEEGPICDENGEAKPSPPASPPTSTQEPLANGPSHVVRRGGMWSRNGERRGKGGSSNWGGRRRTMGRGPSGKGELRV